MARNTRATGSNNFLWEIGDSTTAAYVDSPILKEFHSTGRAQNGNYISFAELIDIGSFSKFGFLGGSNSNFSSQDDYKKNLIDFIRSVDAHLKELDALVTAWEHGQSGFIDVDYITINKSSLKLTSGSSETLTVTVYPSDATNKNVTWESTNTSVATVNRTTGEVTGVAIGTATIIATSVNLGKTAIINVEVVETLTEYYWYVGTTLPNNPPSSINVQTDNTKPGWHSIGSTLTGFIHDMNSEANWVTLVENATSAADLTQYYVVIPNGLTFTDSFNSNLRTNGEYTKESNFNMPGYEAYKSVDDTVKVRGIIFKG